jgi:hypothetical protein
MMQDKVLHYSVQIRLTKLEGFYGNFLKTFWRGFKRLSSR